MMSIPCSLSLITVNGSYENISIVVTVGQKIEIVHTDEDGGYAAGGSWVAVGVADTIRTKHA